MPAKPPVIRLLLVDDHPVVRRGLRAFLDASPQVKIVGEAADGDTALTRARRLKPDVVLMDVNLPGTSGLEATRALRRAVPQCRVLMLTVHSQVEYVLQMIRVGAHGYIAKDAPPAALLRAIRRVARGDAHFTSKHALEHLRDSLAAPGCVVLARRDPLTRREREVLALLADGLSNKQIAAKFGVSVRTVETHRERLRRKLGLRTVAELTRYALAHDLARPSGPRRP